MFSQSTIVAMDKLLLRVTEVSELLGISRSKTYELIGAGVIPAIKVGSSVRVPEADLRRWVAEQSEPGRSQR